MAETRRLQSPAEMFMQKLTDASLARRKGELEKDLQALVQLATGDDSSSQPADSYEDAREFIRLLDDSRVRNVKSEMLAAFVRAVENIASGIIQEERRVRSIRRSRYDQNQTKLF